MGLYDQRRYEKGADAERRNGPVEIWMMRINPCHGYSNITILYSTFFFLTRPATFAKGAGRSTATVCAHKTIGVCH